MMSESTPKIFPDDAGCWLDGHMGWHNTYRVVECAMNFGMELDIGEQYIMKCYHDSDFFEPFTDLGENDLWEAAIELSDKATDYLQSLAPEGYVFEWDMGELSLIQEEEE